ncbi:non-ribosomal peptide synthetase [Delftia sp. PS-11]|uniref:non-ribosomal peptide synthetase n=1 Tax=Delftia sp. PS-11 TaxID=2767222 RepID=UPI0024556BA4|nr:non-ribosomal peptide synthetase [Delftia sp. PS-11]KAJ8744940.1 amino acid adenylation domain-containing protein [Delftia sp. PS-11]
MSNESLNQAPAAKADRAVVEGMLRQIMSKVLPSTPSPEDVHIPFLEMGANSLVLMEVQRSVEARFGLTISIPQFFQELTCMDALAEYIVHNQSAMAPAQEPPAQPQPTVTPVATAVPEPVPAPAAMPQVPLAPLALPAFTQAAPVAGEIEQILRRQMETAAEAINQVVAQQLRFLGGLGQTATQPVPVAAAAPVPAAPEPAVSAPATVAAAPAGAARPTAARPSSALVSHRMLSPLEIRARGLTEKQSQHLEALIALYTSRTQRSKELTARDRGVLADSRAAVGFRFTTKEMLYPIVGKKAQGAYLWDVDGNRYIDITMGQGVTLFGHHPDFIDQALADPDNDALLLGPRPPQTGEAARLICELTGMERVTFTNSGTEAVMAALRLARAATQRQKIVMFDNAYHGHSDNVMGRPVWTDGVLGSVPVAPGITQGSVDDLLLLEYGSDESLDYIRAHAGELAAVIVEPVQSRRPDLQPQAFLRALRQITEEAGALLIFDEMITGFRAHPGGAQALFGVRADIATYGKVLAGGLPIGVVAGAARYMDAIDGGAWNYGDASYPMVDRTIFGGTFCQHPAAMITTVATLRHLKQHSPGLQDDLTRRTRRLAAELNDFFDLEEVPIRVVHFGSLFRFAFSSNLELLFYHLMVRGVFIWEWRNYFLSTAHSDADVDFIVQAVKDSVLAMREGGFLAEKSVAATAVAASAVAAQSRVEMTTAQRQLALLAEISPQGSMAYHVTAQLALGGDLERAALRSALRELMRRHEALRCVVDGHSLRVMPLQALPDAGLRFTDLGDAAQPQAALDEALAVQARTPFDLGSGPLFEAHLFRLGPQQHRLLLKAHHIIIDGLSMNLVVQDLSALYTAAFTGQSVPLPEPLPLARYAEWRNSTRFDRQQAYWLEQLQGPLPVLDLPVDRPAAPVRSYLGGRHSRSLDAALIQRVRERSREHGCTDFMLLFSAYALWLHRLCSQDDLVLGLPVAGRGLPQSDHLVAYCTHLIPVRSRLQWEQSFADYLRQMRTTLLNGYENQDYPYAQLIELPAFKSLHGQLVSTLFNLDRPGSAPAMAGLEVGWLSQPIHHTAFSLILNLTEVDGAMVLECDFSRDLFEPDSIARYVDAFVTLLEAIVATPQQRVCELPLLGSQAARQLLQECNGTATGAGPMACVPQWFEAQAAAAPHDPALRFGQQTLSYAQLNSEANRLAHWLRGQGVGPDVVVGLHLQRSVELVVGLLAILKAGGAYLPLDPAYPAQRLAFMQQDAGVTLLLTQQALQPQWAGVPGLRVLCLDSESALYADAPQHNPQPCADPNHLAYLIYTSGSTGQPKGALIEHQGLANYLRWAVQHYQIGQGEGAPLHSSISFDATITCLLAPLMAGRTLWVLGESEDEPEIEVIRAALGSGRDWSLIKVTPAHLEMLNAMIAPQDLAGTARVVVLGGEALLERHVAPWLAHAPATRLINEYGPTETVVGCCIHEVTAQDLGHGDAVPIGRPIANTQLYVLDARRQPVPLGVKGELYIGGAGVARGYHRRPELTAERFIDLGQTGLASHALAEGAGRRLYKTGDLVRHLPDGRLVYHGRMDNQIKLRGYRVELGEIESAIARLDGVRDVVVVAQRRTALDLRLVAYVVAAAGCSLQPAALRSALAETLPAHMLPGSFVMLEALPVNANGKVDRAELPSPDSHVPASQAPRLDAGGEAERRVAAIWRELLGLEQVGLEDNFFELGGHSLLVLPLRDRLQQAFGRPVAPLDVFRLPTVAAQARFLAEPQAVAEPGAGTGSGPDQDVLELAHRRREAIRQQRDKRQYRA